ncbi:MAG TPA: winged helix-turn-helix domain-containing protein [Sphingomicrobium sp.]|nr:winged helix-turn-helix domain-containing protein [Sphingomicrobium sp.]
MDHPAASKALAIDLEAEPPLRLGGAVIDPISRNAEYQGGSERLQPQTLKVLVALARRRNQVVTRSELIDCCWDSRIVGDDVINRAILMLRHFAERAGGFSIETVPKSGYRLVETARGGMVRAPYWLAVAGAILIVAGAALALWWPSPGRNSTTIAVIAADGSQATGELSRGLLTRLGSLRAAKTDSMKLVGMTGKSASDADLIFEVSGTANGRETEANLVLLEGKDRSLLWSKEFSQPADKLAELEQQLAFTTGRVLECALEGRSAEGKQLPLETFRLYLNGCATLADAYRVDPRRVIPIFSQVVAQAPKFSSGWAKLLLAEAQYVNAEIIFSDRRPNIPIERHIAAARKLDPDLPEAYVAEFLTLPISAFDQRMRLIERASAGDPDNPDLLAIRAEFFLSVGRLNEAIDAARRAFQLDPLTPGLANNLVQTLAYAGRTETAAEELKRVEQLWPGSLTLRDARFRFHLRYGDPREALRIVRSEGVSREFEEFLVARIDPTPVNIERAISAARRRGATSSKAINDLAQLLAQFGREDEAYQLIMGWRRTDQAGAMTGMLFRPTMRKFRSDPRFIRVADHLGLLAHWRNSGKWPDFCSEPDLGYDCKTEAAKLPPASAA